MSITRIGHVGLTVPDLEAWTGFFTDVVGLQEIERGDGTVHLTCSHRHTAVRLTAGDGYGCDGVGLDVADGETLDDLVARAGRFGLEVVDDGPAPGIDRVVRVTGAAVPVLELCHGAHRAPVAYDASYATHGPRPRKLGHVTFQSSDVDRTAAILQEYLGFRLSDTVPDQYAWYRCNSDHHGIGLGHGPDVVHHYAFELRAFEEFRQLGDHLVREGRELVWGPGRHGPSHNVFAYFLDPSGGMVEMYTDMLQVEDEATYRPSEFTAEEAGNQWGPGTVPPDAWLHAASPYLRPAVVAR